MPSILPPTWNTAKARSYVVRLPLLTRCFAAAIFVFWFVGLQGFFDVQAWGNLDPKEVGFGTCRSSPCDGVEDMFAGLGMHGTWQWDM